MSGNRVKKAWRLTTVVAASMLMLPIVTVGSPAHAADKGQRLTRGQYLNKGDFIYRPFVVGNGKWRLIMQTDGNLVMYAPSNEVCFNADTVGKGHHAVYQRDGNFVLYNASGRALWASNTVGDDGTTVDISAKGRLFVGFKDVTRKDCF